MKNKGLRGFFKFFKNVRPNIRHGIRPVDVRADKFVRLVASIDDTPTLIRLIAGNRDYLKFCVAIVREESRGDKRFVRMRQKLYRQMAQHRLPPEGLRRKLLPVAASLGLAHRGMEESAEPKDDYYGILGISPGATPAEIHHAYRLKSLRTHPDTAFGTKEEFLEIQQAFSILSDHCLRRQYDSVRARKWLWVESAERKAGGADMGDGLNRVTHRHIFYILMLFLVLLALICLADFLNREIAMGL